MKLCLIYNFAQHYRSSIFILLDKVFDIDFFFGDDMADVKKMDYSLLHNEVKELRNRHFSRLEWQSDSIKLGFKKYDAYIMLGSPMCISTWICSIIARLRGKTVLFWTHGWYGKESVFERTIKKVFFRIPNKVLLYGNYARELMISNGFKPGNLLVIHNSLYYDRQKEIRNSLRPTDIYRSHFGNNLPTVIFIGRLTPIKKLHQLLEAQSVCNLNSEGFNVVFVGDGSERIKLESYSVENGLAEKVWFYGPSYDENELSSLIYNADLCVAPGNIGLTAMHALVYGCPCISHNDFKWQMPEFEAIRPGVTGDYFEKDNIESLAKTIITWLQEKQSQRDLVRQACYDEIDTSWTPYYQLSIIQKALGV